MNETVRTEKLMDAMTMTLEDAFHDDAPDDIESHIERMWRDHWCIMDALTDMFPDLETYREKYG